MSGTLDCAFCGKKNDEVTLMVTTENFGGALAPGRVRHDSGAGRQVAAEHHAAGALEGSAGGHVVHPASDGARRQRDGKGWGTMTTHDPTKPPHLWDNPAPLDRTFRDLRRERMCDGKVLVFMVKPAECSGWLYVERLEDAEGFMLDGELEDMWEVKMAAMTREEIDALPEFGGW